MHQEGRWQSQFFISILNSDENLHQGGDKVDEDRS